MTLPALWLCADLDHPRAESLGARVGRALEAGPAVVWLRAPHGAPAREVLALARALVSLSRGSGAVFVGDRADIALAAGADGVHLPERAFDPAALRGWPLLRSRAVHDVRGAERFAMQTDALVASPFRAVPGKGEPLGAEGLGAIVRAAGTTPVIALGGVQTPDDVRACVDAGARGVAVRRALLDADDPLPVCAALQRALAQLTAPADPCDARPR